MSSSSDFVSVVMPIHNGARFLAEALDSIRRQGHAALEVIIVDDGSTDDTPRMIDELAADPANRIRSVRTANRGPSAARNTGIELARGELIAFLDADDLWPDGKLSRQLARLALTPSLQVVHGRIEYRELPGAAPSMARFRHLVDPVVSVNLGAGLFRKEAFSRIGPFDESLRHGEDTDWFFRAIEAGIAITVVSDVTLIYRLHDGNLMTDVGAATRSMTTVLRRSLERRRRAGDGAARPLAQLSAFLEANGQAR